MAVQVVRANVTHDEGQKAWDRFNYLIALGIKEYIEKGGDLTVLDKQKDLTFEEWYDYVQEFKRKNKEGSWFNPYTKDKYYFFCAK